MKDREIICRFYCYAGGPCNKRDIPVHFKEECQICKFYEPRKGGIPLRKDNRARKREKIDKKEMRCQY